MSHPEGLVAHSASPPPVDTSIEDMSSTGIVAEGKAGNERQKMASKLPESREKKLLTRESTEFQVITKAAQLHAQELPTNEQRDPEETVMTHQEGIKGGYAYTLVDEDLHNEVELKCQICQFIPREPAKVSCCGLIFCRSCIASHCEENSVCPSCNETFDWIIDKLLERKIHGLQVYCVNFDKGCDWSGDLSHMKEHTRKIADQGTGDTGIEKCQYELTTCKKCDEEMMYVELDDHMTDYCQHRVTRCDFEFAGCQFEGSKVSMPKHLQDNTSRHLSLLGELVKDSHAKMPYQYYFFWGLLTLFALATVIHIFQALPNNTNQQDGKFHHKSLRSKFIDLKRRMIENELAVQSIQNGIDIDVHQRLHELEAIVEDLKTGVLKLAIASTDVEMDILKSSISQLKNEIMAELKPIFSKQISDAIETTDVDTVSADVGIDSTTANNCETKMTRKSKRGKNKRKNKDKKNRNKKNRNKKNRNKNRNRQNKKKMARPMK